MADIEVINLGDYHHFDTLDTKQNEVKEGSVELSFLKTTSLSTVDVKFEGKLQDVSDREKTPTDPMDAYAVAANNSKSLLESASARLQEALSIAQQESDDVEGKVDAITRSVSELEKSVASHSRKVKDAEEREGELLEELLSIEKQIMKNRQELYHKSLKEVDIRIAELEQSTDEYSDIVEQDREFLQTHSLALYLFERAEELIRIHASFKEDAAAMSDKYGSILEEIEEHLSKQKCLRLHEKVQTCLLEYVARAINSTSNESSEDVDVSINLLDKDDFVSAIDEIVKEEFDKISGSQNSPELADELAQAKANKRELELSGSDSVFSSEVQKLVALKQDLANEMDMLGTQKLQQDEKEEKALLVAKKRELAQLKNEFEQKRGLLAKLEGFNLSKSMSELTTLSIDNAEVAEPDDMLAPISEASGKRNDLLRYRGEIIELLDQIDLKEELTHETDMEGKLSELSVDIALSADIDKLLVLRINLFKEILLETNKATHLSERYTQVVAALENVEKYDLALEQIEKLVQDTGLEKQDLSKIQKFRADLQSAQTMLAERKAVLHQSLEESDQKRDRFLDKIDNINSKIQSFRQDGGFDYLVKGESLEEQYEVHMRLLDKVAKALGMFAETQDLINRSKPLEEDTTSAPSVVVEHSEEQVKKEPDGPSLADELSAINLDDSLASELAAAEEEAANREAQFKAALEGDAIDSYNEFVEGIRDTSTPIPQFVETEARALPTSSMLDRAESVKSKEEVAGIRETTSRPLPTSQGIAAVSTSQDSVSQVARIDEVAANSLPTSSRVGIDSTVKSSSAEIATISEFPARNLPTSGKVKIDNASTEASADRKDSPAEIGAVSLPTAGQVGISTSVKSNADVVRIEEVNARALPHAGGLTIDASVLSNQSPARIAETLARDLPQADPTDFSAMMNMLSADPPVDNGNANAVVVAEAEAVVNLADAQLVVEEGVIVPVSSVGRSVESSIATDEVTSAGALNVDVYDTHAKAPIIAEKGLFGITASGPSHKPSIYSALVAKLNALQETRAASSGSVVHEQMPTIKPKTAELLRDTHLKMKGADSESLGSGISMSMYSKSEIKGLEEARGFIPGNWLLWTKEQLLTVDATNLEMQIAQRF